MTRIICITDESAWLVEQGAVSARVMARASFGHHLPTDIQYSGPVLEGPDGAQVRVGGRLVFRSMLPVRDGFGRITDETQVIEDVVTSGIIRRIVNWTDAPEAKEENDGVITLTPSWNWLLPFFTANPQVRHEARRALTSADLLVVLLDMGRVTQDDLREARLRLDRKF